MAGRCGLLLASALLVAGGIPSEALRRGSAKLPFAARFQGLLIVVMLIGFVLILQQASKPLYVVGLPIMVVAAFLQIAFGNIPPRFDFKKSMALLALTWAIVAAVFVISIRLAPYLLALGR